MPTVYACDHCQATATSLVGWFIVSAQFLHMDATAPLSGRVLDTVAPDLLFDKPECRDAWCATAGLVAPAQAPAA